MTDILSDVGFSFEIMGTKTHMDLIPNKATTYYGSLILTNYIDDLVINTLNVKIPKKHIEIKHFIYTNILQNIIENNDLYSYLPQINLRNRIKPSKLVSFLIGTISKQRGKEATIYFLNAIWKSNTIDVVSLSSDELVPIQTLNEKMVRNNKQISKKGVPLVISKQQKSFKCIIYTDHSKETVLGEGFGYNKKNAIRNASIECLKKI